MEQFNPYRMIGRISRTFRILMQRYNLSLRYNNVDLKEAIDAMATRITGSIDIALLKNMSIALDDYAKQAESLNLEPQQIRDETAIGEREAQFIFQEYSYNYAARILELTDFEQERIKLANERAEQQRAKNRKRLRIGAIILGIVAAFVIGRYIYNLPYFAERRAYAALEKEYNEKGRLSIWDVQRFIYDFPDNEHVEELIMLSARSANKRGKTDELHQAIYVYLERYPDGQYADECRQYYDQIWTDGIKSYRSSVGFHRSDYEDFVIEMLNYMHTNNLNTVLVVPHLINNLKDFSEYPEDVKRKLSNGIYLYGLTIPGSIRSAKKFFNKYDFNKWGFDYEYGLEESINKPFNASMIIFNVIEPDSVDAHSAEPALHLYYRLSNLDYADGSPNLLSVWEEITYGDSGSCYKSGVGIFFHIKMELTAEFIIPGSESQIVATASCTTNDINLENMEGYSQLCTACAKQCYNLIKSNFDLPAR